jgi:predicted nucleic acid-binding Zn finger protein
VNLASTTNISKNMNLTEEHKPSPGTESDKSRTEPIRVRKARDVVESQGVKLHRFLPSGRTIWTVVGRDCDFLVDFSSEPQDRLYCSCSDFYFRVLSERIPECYHLLAAKIAVEEEMYSVIDFSDEEFAQFLRALVTDIFRYLTFRKPFEPERQP